MWYKQTHTSRIRNASVWFSFLLFCVLLLTAVFSGCSIKTEKIDSDASLQEFTSYLDQRVPQLLDHFDIPGLTIALVHDRQPVWSGSYGFADQEKETPMTGDAIFRAGSISKPLTAWGVMRLAEKGVIDLDKPVEKYLSRWEFPEGKYESEEVTIRRLLSHTAGLPPAIGGGYTPEEELPPLESILAGEENEEEVRITREPGSAFSYSNPGYMVLELLIEEVANQSYASYMKKEVLEPLGMQDSTYVWSRELEKNTATGYYADGSPVPILLDAAKAPGGIYTTAGDLARFLAANMTGPDGEPAGRDILKSEKVNQMHTPVIETSSFYALISDAYGLGYMVETLPTGEQAVFHGGQHTGWISHSHLYPETGEGLVILTNSERSQHLQVHILKDWAEWMGYTSPKMSNTFAYISTVLGILTGLFLLASCLLAWRLLRGVISGRFSLAPFSRNQLASRLIRAGVSLLLFILWWGVVPYLLKLYLPVISFWLGIALCAFAAILMLSAVFPEKSPDN